MLLSTFVLSVTALFGASDAINPGFQTAVTSKALDYILEVGIPYLESELSSLEIDDLSGDAHVAVVGKISYQLTNIQLSNLQIEDSSFTSGSVGLTLAITGISIDGSANWHYSNHGWIHLSDRGTMSLGVSGATISMSVLLGKDIYGHATLTTSGCTMDPGSVSIEFHGGASWLYNLFDDYLEDTLKANMQSQLCSSATQAVNTKGNTALETLPVKVKVDNIAVIDYSLIQSPVFTGSYIETRHKGEFQLTTGPVDIPLTPTALPPLQKVDKMMYLWLTDYIANSAGIVYYTAGRLQHTITDDMVPKNMLLRLNTKSLKPLIPQLYTKYPDMAVQLVLKAVKPPSVQMTKGDIMFTINGGVEFDVVYPNSTTVNAFTLGMNLYTGVALSLVHDGTNNAIRGNCTAIKFELNMISSNIGTVKLDPIHDIVNIAQVLVVEKINKVIGAGWEIPAGEGFHLIDPKLSILEGYAVFGADINYRPTWMK